MKTAANPGIVIYVKPTISSAMVLEFRGTSTASSFDHYSIVNVPAGTYHFAVRSKRYPQTLIIADNVMGVDFTALE